MHGSKCYHLLQGENIDLNLPPQFGLFATAYAAIFITIALKYIVL